MDPRVRQLRIRSGVVRRLAKELQVYSKEAEQQRGRLQAARDGDADEYVVKKHDEVLREALMMVPDCERRLTKAQNDLREILESEADLKGNEEYEAAGKILQESIVKEESSLH